MRRGNLFWGVVLVLFGGLFLLQAAGYLAGNIFEYFWPVFLIMLGIWFISSVFPRSQSSASEVVQDLSVDLGDATRASLKIEHGAGHIYLEAGTSPGVFMTGTSGTGLNLSSKHAGDELVVKIEAGPSFLPFIGPEGGAWRFRLNPDIPTRLDVEAGASQLDLDLSELKVTHFELDTGASSTNLTLPSNAGNTIVDIDAGAASVNIRVPDGVGARIRIDQGVTSLNIDDSRFERLDSGFFQSRDFDVSENKAEIKIDAGAGAIKIT